MSVYAYLRVSKETSTTANQKKLLQSCDFNIDEYVVEGAVSGSIPAGERPEFARLLKILKKGDTVIVTMLDRIGRNTIDVLTTVQRFQKLGVRFRALQLDSIDLTSTMGKLLLSMLASMAELERDLIIERTKAGLARTKEAGTILGAPMKISPETLKAMLTDKHGDFKMSNKAIAEKYNLHINTVFNILKKWYGNFDGYKIEYAKRELQYKTKELK